MQIETLKIFCDLVDSASFSTAAKRNGITQSAVSQQIRALEKKFNVSFFERGKKNFSMTPEGQVFEEAAREMLEVFISIDDRLKQMQNLVSGPLRVCTIFSIGLHDLPPRIKEFQKRFREVEMKIDYKRYDQVYTEVLEGRADLGLVAYPQKRKGVVVEVFDEDELVVICPHDHKLANRRVVSINELSGENFISFGPDTPTRRAVDRLLRGHSVEHALNIELDNIETVKRAVEVSNGVSLVPRRAVEPEVEMRRLVALDIAGERHSRPLGILRKRTRATSPAMREFVQVLKDCGSISQNNKKVVEVEVDDADDGDEDDSDA
jgi:LysR family transcriptional regulator, transcriptional activator of the cysJI operon